MVRFIAVSAKKMSTVKSKITKLRGMSNFNLDEFLFELKQVMSITVPKNCNNVNEQFQIFFDMCKQAVNKFSSLRKATRKGKRLNAKQWITKGILKSVKTK